MKPYRRMRDLSSSDPTKGDGFTGYSAGMAQTASMEKKVHPSQMKSITRREIRRMLQSVIVKSEDYEDIWEEIQDGVFTPWDIERAKYPDHPDARYEVPPLWFKEDFCHYILVMQRRKLEYFAEGPLGAEVAMGASDAFRFEQTVAKVFTNPYLPIEPWIQMHDPSPCGTITGIPGTGKSYLATLMLQMMACKRISAMSNIPIIPKIYEINHSGACVKVKVTRDCYETKPSDIDAMLYIITNMQDILTARSSIGFDDTMTVEIENEEKTVPKPCLVVIDEARTSAVFSNLMKMSKENQDFREILAVYRKLGIGFLLISQFSVDISSDINKLFDIEFEKRTRENVTISITGDRWKARQMELIDYEFEQTGKMQYEYDPMAWAPFSMRGYKLAKVCFELEPNAVKALQLYHKTSREFANMGMNVDAQPVTANGIAAMMQDSTDGPIVGTPVKTAKIAPIDKPDNLRQIDDGLWDDFVSLIEKHGPRVSNKVIMPLLNISERQATRLRNRARHEGLIPLTHAQIRRRERAVPKTPFSIGEE